MCVVAWSACSQSASARLCSNSYYTSVNFRTRSLLSKPKSSPTVSASKSTFTCHNINNHHYLQQHCDDHEKVISPCPCQDRPPCPCWTQQLPTSKDSDVNKLLQNFHVPMQARSFSVCFEYNGFCCINPSSRIFTWISLLQCITNDIPFILLCKMFSNLISISKPRQLQSLPDWSPAPRFNLNPKLHQTSKKSNGICIILFMAEIRHQLRGSLFDLIIYRVLYIHGAGFFHQHYFLQNSGWDHRFAKICYHHSITIMNKSKNSCKFQTQLFWIKHTHTLAKWNKQLVDPLLPFDFWWTCSWNPCKVDGSICSILMSGFL